ncbi:unnamed protein product [Phytophthora fragariaefolia]|uniref:Unnamed protein product n=1 Tax=Phytophthora fragariaefolia TaxID=1490495 RepID=A0A9W7CZY6_9STRA|nr:unnamed protein product [Phytophthora fragariaefolia]
MSGFSYTQPIFNSPVYNPAFYLSLGASGFLTYDYAQTLYLGKNDYRLTYISGITLGVVTPGIALVPGIGGDISGIGSLGCTNLTVNGFSIVAPPSYVIGIIEGLTAASKALVLDANKDVSGISSLLATTFSGTLQTAAQPNITSVRTLTNISTSGALTMSGISISSSEFAVLDGVVAGTAQASKALFLNLSLSISGIGSLSASGTINLAESQWGLLGIQYQSRDTTYTDSGSAANSIIVSSAINSYDQPTIAASNTGITITRAATVYIENRVASGANTTISNSYSLWIPNGKVLLGDTTAFSSTTTGALQPRRKWSTDTLSTAAQPKITSVGTLSSLSASGSLTGTLSTAAQPNITSVGTLLPLSVSGAVSITNSTYYSSPSNGALILSGGIGITKNLYIGSSQTVSSWATTGPQIATITATYTNSSTISGGTTPYGFYISGAPISGSNMTITNPYALLIASGRVLLDGAVSATSLTSGTSQVSGSMSVGVNLYCSYMNTSSDICIH